MNRIKEESLAGKSQPSRYDAGYDCELPAGVQAQLVSPRRPPIANRPNLIKSQPRGPLYFVLATCAITLVGALYTSWRQGEAERARKASSSSSRNTRPRTWW